VHSRHEAAIAALRDAHDADAKALRLEAVEAQKVRRMLTYADVC
jgi:hypothetical protein